MRRLEEVGTYIYNRPVPPRCGVDHVAKEDCAIVGIGGDDDHTDEVEYLLLSTNLGWNADFPLLTAGIVISCQRLPPRPSDIQEYINVVTKPRA